MTVTISWLLMVMIWYVIEKKQIREVNLRGVSVFSCFAFQCGVFILVLFKFLFLIFNVKAKSKEVDYSEQGSSQSKPSVLNVRTPPKGDVYMEDVALSQSILSYSLVKNGLPHNFNIEDTQWDLLIWKFEVGVESTMKFAAMCLAVNMK
jgi:hypothetical protein